MGRYGNVVVSAGNEKVVVVSETDVDACAFAGRVVVEVDCGLDVDVDVGGGEVLDDRDVVVRGGGSVAGVVVAGRVLATVWLGAGSGRTSKYTASVTTKMSAVTAVERRKRPILTMGSARCRCRCRRAARCLRFGVRSRCVPATRG